jgi:hypothetical protein
MSWTDPCGNCGSHRADCDCKKYACVQTHTCEYCASECKKKNVDNNTYGSCINFELAKKKYRI